MDQGKWAFSKSGSEREVRLKFCPSAQPRMWDTIAPRCDCSASPEQRLGRCHAMKRGASALPNTSNRHPAASFPAASTPKGVLTATSANSGISGGAPTAIITSYEVCQRYSRSVLVAIFSPHMHSFLNVHYFVLFLPFERCAFSASRICLLCCRCVDEAAPERLESIASNHSLNPRRCSPALASMQTSATSNGRHACAAALSCFLQSCCRSG